MRIFGVLRIIVSITSLASVFILLPGCAKEKHVNQKPVLNYTSSSDGLKVTVQGNATDPDGTIASVTVYWGDNSTSQLPSGEFAGFEASTIYKNPAGYTIRITARDDAGDSTSIATDVAADFRETSLINIKPGMFRTSDNEFLVLTLNLHTYQESRQSEKLQMIADVIGKMNIDFIAFQECAQNRSAAIAEGIIREDNMARIICERIFQKYQVSYDFVWNWSHYGWDVWEEGVAVLSRFPVTLSEDRYISTDKSTGSITSRKVIYAACQSPHGVFNMFSVHTHWRLTVNDEEQDSQVNNIKSMVLEKESSSPDAFSIVCGDFNGNPTSDYPWSEGYNTMMRTGEYTDTFLTIYPDGNQKPAQSIYNTIGGTLPGRIDYIFLKTDSRLQVMDSQIIFTPGAVGMVSDHFGVISKVRIVN
jgi:maltose 6'-phosphate phosphatase